MMICYTSSGINLFMHTCGGKLSELSFSEADANCGMENSKMQYHNYCKSSLDSVDACCQNHSVKSPHHIQILEKVDSQPTKNISTIVAPQFFVLQNFVYHLKLVEVISPHLRYQVDINPKKVIYLMVQNFRN
ncbi:hypothetical protein N9R54_00190 [Pelobium sp.]|nr:hypothetical protein [Pelobium sp.]